MGVRAVAWLVNGVASWVVAEVEGALMLVGGGGESLI